MRNVFVTTEQAGSDFYLRLVRFHMYYIQELWLGTVLVNAYLTNAQVPVFNQCLEKESL